MPKCRIGILITLTSGQNMRFLQIFSSALGADPRPSKFFALLRSLGQVDVCACPPVATFGPVEHFTSLPQRPKALQHKITRAAGLIARRYEADIWFPAMRTLLNQFSGKQYAAIVCHDALLLPFALAVSATRADKAKRCPVIMDAREFYPRQFEHQPLWRFVLHGINDYVCRRYLPQADLVFTVSPGLVEGYRKDYGVSCELLPSYADFQDITPYATDAGGLRCIHHGAAMPGRHIENMLEAFALLQGRAQLDLMLVPSNVRYLEKLKRMAVGIPNVNFVDPVPMKDIVAHIARYDVGVYLLHADSFNHRHALPNKLFEFIQARLAVAVSPVPDMAGLVCEQQVGVVAADFSPQAFAACIGALAPADVDRYKANANKAAHVFCWEQNDVFIREKLFALMDN
ncbi:MAG: hypothetical protein DESF_00765 [Desulfovibrio sp.]